MIEGLRAERMNERTPTSEHTYGFDFGVCVS